MRKLFYPRLAAGNLKLNRRFYAPYLLTVVVCCSMFYNLCFVLNSRGLQQVGGAATGVMLNMMLSMGAVIVGVFSCIFLLYSNSLLVKQRKRELGLYSVLGMQKGNIAKVMLWESAYVNSLGILLGLTIGILLSKLALLVLCAIMRFQVPFGFEVSPAAVGLTAALFLAISLVNLLISLLRVRLLNPIELLHGGSQGEKPPRLNWPLALLGALFLGAGYVIAVCTVNPVNAFTFFFVAVLLVILGTYCLFIAGSIAVLRALKRRKEYYYRLRHFIPVSGMLYRMRRNGAGLASICILSTMVLVMLSTTVCLNLGVDASLDRRYPYDMMLSTVVYEDDGKHLTPEQVRAKTKAALEQAGLIPENEYDYRCRMLNVRKNGGGFQVYTGSLGFESDAVSLTLMSMEECAKWMENPITLAADEAVCVSARGGEMDTFSLEGHSFRCVENAALQAFLRRGGERESALYDSMTVILRDENTILDLFKAAPYADAYERPMWQMNFDLPGLSDEEKIGFRESLRDALTIVYPREEGGLNHALTVRIECRALESADFYGTYGGLLFIGLFLGAMFLMATAMIIYYKQISEGYEDKGRYEIMRKVGMTDAEVRTTISGQIMTVFFLPLAAAVTHLLFAFPMIRRMLLLFELNNIGLFALCTLITVLVFAAVYAFIYRITARMYYHIVEG